MNHVSNVMLANLNHAITEPGFLNYISRACCHTQQAHHKQGKSYISFNAIAYFHNTQKLVRNIAGSHKTKALPITMQS